jgi:hypothetical protein
MRGFGVAKLATAMLLCVAGVMLSASPARADVVFFDKDGWAVYTKGLIASHFQYAFGDGDPSTTHVSGLVGGKILPNAAVDPKDNSLKLARVRSGFIGTQLGIGVRRKISDSVNVDSLVAINLADISSNRNQEVDGNKGVDVREAWAAVSTPVGTFKMGRMFEIFGAGSAPVVLISHKFAVGNPCFVDAPTIACASVGAGPMYAGFDAQLRYETPRFGGLQAQVSVSDPWTGPGYSMTPIPRFDAEINFDKSFSETARLRIFAEGVFQQVQRRAFMPDAPLIKGTILGGMGTAILNLGGLAVGGGGWQCQGCGTRTVMEIGDGAAPLAYDTSPKYEMRVARGVFGNAGYTFYGYTIAGGGGAAFVRPTESDLLVNSPVSILRQSIAYHVTLAKQIDAIVLSAEFMRWHNDWHFGEKQTQTYTGAGANFVW